MSIKIIYKKFLEESVNVGIYAFLFLLPWQTRLILKANDIGYLEVGVYAVDLLLVFLVIAKFLGKNFQFSIFNFQSIFNFKISKFKKPAFWIFIFTLWSIVSIFWSSDKILAMQHVFWLLLSVGLGWLVYNAADIKKIIFWFCLGLILPAWLVIWQFATQSSFANKWLGLAMHKAALGGASVVETFSNDLPQRWLRAYGSFDHPNILGAVMVMGIVFVTCLFVQRSIGCHPERNDDAIAEECSRRISAEIPRLRSAPLGMTMSFYTAIISFAAACFLSFSRSAWAGLIIGLGGIGFFLLRNPSLLRYAEASKLRNRVFNYLKVIVIVVAVFLVLGVTYRDVLLVRTDGGTRLEKKSLDDRAIYFQQAKEIIKQHPIVGVGAGNYIAYLKEKNPNNYPWNYQPVHNVFMLIWTEIGLVGMLAFALFYVTIVLRAYRNSPLGFCLLLAFLPAMFFDHWLWSLHFGLLFLGLINGLILNKRFLAAVDI